MFLEAFLKRANPPRTNPPFTLSRTKASVRSLRSAKPPAAPLAEAPSSPQITASELLPSGSSDRVAGFQKTHADAAFCVTCGHILLSARSHRSRSGTKGGSKHEVRGATPEEISSYLDRGGGRRRGAGGPTDGVLNFGRHKGLTIAQVQAKAPSYISWMIESKIHETRPTVRALLDTAGISYPPISAAQDAVVSVTSEVTSARPAPRPLTRPRKKRKRAAMTGDGNCCLQCGSSEHNTRRCPLAQSALVERSQVALAYRGAGKAAHKIVALKHTPMRQRTPAYKDRPAKRALAPVARLLLDLQRAPPQILSEWMVADGFFQDLSGRPCTKCSEGKMQAGYSNDSVLGKLCGSDEINISEGAVVLDITLHTACYRCKSCRQRYMVTFCHPLIPPGGHGSTSPSLWVFCAWNFLEDKTVTMTCRELGLDRRVVSDIYDIFRMVLAEDALRLQDQIVFGGRGNETTVVETDETCFGKWRVHHANGKQDNYWYVWIGICQRGDLRIYSDFPADLV